MLAHGNEMTYRRDLLWLGAAGVAVSAIAALFVGPVRSTSMTTRMSTRDTYRQGFTVARSQPWFRRYVIACLLFAPVTLGTTFYALHTAHQSGSLHVLVILSSIGLVFGSPLWRKVYRLFGVPSSNHIRFTTLVNGTIFTLARTYTFRQFPTCSRNSISRGLAT
jgi:hypothetical protein